MWCDVRHQIRHEEDCCIDIRNSKFKFLLLHRAPVHRPIFHGVVAAATNSLLPFHSTIHLSFRVVYNSTSLPTMWFCPLDGTLLQVECLDDQNHFVCRTCSYTSAIRQAHTRTTPTAARKQVDDILGGVAAWENVDRTAAVCPACHHGEAYFLQMQIRSADEPMSIFYKCVKCSHQWNDK